MNDRQPPRVSAVEKYLPGTAALLAVIGIFAWLFGGALFADRSFVYRDAAHYYDPLFEFTADEWAAGRIPLWNPYDGLGKPLLADTTSSVLYPGKVIFALPLSFATKYKWYLGGHVLLAAGTAFLLARRWGASRSAAGVSGLSYAFCGNVVFQYCNVVFLVGAAWLPLAVYCTDRLLVRRRIVWAPALGCVLALMTFGGDPQTAYHAGLLAAGYALLLWLRQRRRRRRSTAARDDLAPPAAPPSPALITRLRSHRLVLLATAAIIGFVLAAVQILPAMQWSRRSHRAAYDVPRTLYEVPGQLCRKPPQLSERGVTEALLAKSRTGEHLQHVYYFSFSPWRLAEYVWPNISGRQFPTHRRWIETLPAEGLAWTPTCYMGLLPLLCAVFSLRLRRGPVRYRWISWTVILAVLGSFGWYGMGWLVTEFCYAIGDDPAKLPFGPAFGGVYWLMTVLLPGYVYFRYPGKLLIVAALGLSLLAARGWDRAFAGLLPRLRSTLLGLAALSLTGGAALCLLWPWWDSWLSGVGPNVLFGPMDADGAWRDVAGAFVHTAILCGLLWCLLPRSQDRSGPGALSPTVRPTLALLLTAAEMAIANGWLVPTAPREHWEAPGPLAATIRDYQDDDTDPPIVRVDRSAPRHWFPVEWSSSSSVTRQTEALISDNATLMPRFNLRSRIGILDADGTIVSQDYSTFLVEARWSGPPRWGRGRFLHPGVQDALSTDFAIVHSGDELPPDWSRAGDFSPHSAPVVSPTDGKNADQGAATPFASLWHNDDPQPRVWIARKVSKLPSLNGNAPVLVRRRTRDVLFSTRRFRDMRRWAVVETMDLSSERLGSLNFRSRGISPGELGESCQLVTEEPQRVVVEARLEGVGLVVLNDFYDPAWKARVTGTTSEWLRKNPRLDVLRANRVMRGVILPAGQHTIAFRYRPTTFYVGAIFSAVGWLTLVLATLLTWLRWTVAHHGVFTRFKV